MSGIINSAGSKSGVIGNTEIDYEEGEWTGAIEGSGNNMTMSSKTGFYTKVGNIVHITGYFNVTSLGDPAATGGINLRGLPFTVANDPGAYTCGGIRCSNLAITAGHSVTFYAAIDEELLGIGLWDSTVGVSNLQASEFTAAGTMIIGLSYRVKSDERM